MFDGMVSLVRPKGSDCVCGHGSGDHRDDDPTSACWLCSCHRHQRLDEGKEWDDEQEKTSPLGVAQSRKP